MRASERKLVPGPTTPDQKTMRTTLRKSKVSVEVDLGPGRGKWTVCQKHELISLPDQKLTVTTFTSPSLVIWP